MEKVSDIEVAKKMISIKQSADTRGIIFDMSFKRVRQLLNMNKCFITGANLNRVNGDDNQLTFDRLDNTKGYIDSNVVACSLRMNRVKDALTVEDITMLYTAIVKKSKK
jgi:hypothetical protein